MRKLTTYANTSVHSPAALCLTLLAASSIFLVVNMAEAQSGFLPLGDLPGGSFSSNATGISDNGMVVVGYGENSTNYEAFRWTQAGGMVGLGDLPGGSMFSLAWGVNADGSVAVGQSSSASGTEAFRWTQAGGMVGLGFLPGGGSPSVARGVNADGSVVVGDSGGASGTEAFLWTQATGMVGLGDIAGGIFMSSAWGVSADGSVVVGGSVSASGFEAFRWTQTGGMVGLGDLSGGLFHSWANGVSADGAVVVGQGRNADDYDEAFRWTQAGGMVGLGDLPGGNFASFAYGANADGSVVVGQGTGATAREAFRWTQAGGMQTVTAWLAANGVVVAPGYTLQIANDVSADGNVVVGGGDGPNGPEAWLARVSSIGSGVLALDESLAQSLGSSSLPLDGAVEHANLVLNGAHHRPLMTSAFPEGRLFAWASGDMARYGFGRKATIGLAEAGFGGYLIPNRLTAGLGVGTSFIDQDTVSGGRADLDGQHLLGEIDFRPAGLGADLLFSVTGLYADWDAGVRRGYLNAGLPDSSMGNPDVSESALRARVDWLDAWRLSGVSFSPRVQASVIRAEMDGYTESGGGFPARFDGRDHTAREMRYGLRASAPVGPETVLHADLEGVHRFDQDRTGTSGELLGLFDFDLRGQSISRDWVRFGLEMDRRLNPNWTISISAHAATWGEDPEISGGFSLKAGW